jgi:hypothetical protein
MSEPRVLTLAKARKQLRHAIGQLDALRWTLTGIELSLPEPLAEQVRLAEMSDEMDAVTELRTVLHCVLEDSIRPAVQDLQEVLASTGSAEEP